VTVLLEDKFGLSLEICTKFSTNLVILVGKKCHFGQHVCQVPNVIETWYIFFGLTVRIFHCHVLCPF